MIHTLIALIILSLPLGGCARLPQQELQAAQAAVARAYAADAHHYAPFEYEEASAALRDGEKRIRLGDYRRAREILPLATANARRAERRAHEEKAAQKTREEQAAREEPARRAAQRKTGGELQPQVTDTAPRHKEAPPRSSEHSPPQPSAAAPAVSRSAPPLPPPPPTAIYTVAAGENLWTIAARKDVYADALLWPLLYKANRDQIKDPRQIYPGQVLNVPRDYSVEEEEKARETARASRVFPVENIIRNSPATP